MTKSSKGETTTTTTTGAKAKAVVEPERKDDKEEDDDDDDDDEDDNEQATDVDRRRGHGSYSLASCDSGRAGDDGATKERSNFPPDSGTSSSYTSAAGEEDATADATTCASEGGRRQRQQQQQQQPQPQPPLAESQTRRLVALLDPPDDRPPDADADLLCMGFNQDGGCLAVGTSSGFRICNVCPFGETFRRTVVEGRRGEGDGDGDGDGDGKGAQAGDDDEADGSGGGDAVPPGEASTGDIGRGGGGIGRISMLYRTNLLALVGGGPSPRYPPNKVLIWDDRLHRPIGELSFRKAVLNVLLRRDRVCVALRDRVYVYDFADLRLLDCVETGDNPMGLACISTSDGAAGGAFGGGGGAAAAAAAAAARTGGRNGSGGMVLACPGIPKGQVRVELYGYRKTLLIDAHEGNVAAMALTVNGTYLATASEKGTVIRMFHTGLPQGRHVGNLGAGGTTSTSADSGTPLREFRRGVERAHVTCLAFSLDGRWLGCASDRGTVHVFRAAEEGDEDGGGTDDDVNRRRMDRKKKKKKSSLFASRLLPGVVSHSKRYFMEGEGSYAQVRGIPDPKACAFVPDRPDTVAVAGLDEYGNGCLLIAGFGKDSGGGGGAEGGSAAALAGTTATATATASATSGMIGGGDAGSAGEAKRVGYHRFFRKAAVAGGGKDGGDGAGGTRKTKRTTSRSAGLGNRYPEDDTSDGRDAASGGVDDAAMAGIARGMDEFVFGDEDMDDGFVSIDTENAPGDKDKGVGGSSA